MADEPRRADVLISDCPIQPHVWREFRDRPKAGLELIAHLRQDASAVTVAGQLREWLPQRGEKGRNSIFAFDAFVLVDVVFDELVTALLPLTAWSDLLVGVSHLSADELDAELRVARRLGSEGTSPPRPMSEPSTHLSQEDYGRLRWLLAQVIAVQPRVSGSRMKKMLMTASDRADAGGGPLVSVGYNRWAEPAVSETRRTIKADAAEKVFDVDCSRITWAVVDTGIDARHPMFANPNAQTGESRLVKAYDVPAGITALRDHQGAAFRFASISTDEDWLQFESAALVTDASGQADRFAVAANDHGTHVAGILAGDKQASANLDQATVRGDEPEELEGICPTLNLVDIRVFDKDGRSREFEVVLGLAFLRWLNRKQDPRIDGVNISLSIPFAVDNFACGWTPVCVECERLVSDGVVVVTSAGNSGFDDSRGTMSIGAGFQLISIADPGNAETVITVGATHRTDPHRYGPISRSARGPTADGRHKPDLLAPGDNVWGPVPNDRWGKKTGTSQAAPHVSGVAAMLLARFPELRGKPYLVKEILLETATDLRRLIDFQGHGLVDALRALQRP